jgi:hypothetical protein
MYYVRHSEPIYDQKIDKLNISFDPVIPPSIFAKNKMTSFLRIKELTKTLSEGDLSKFEQMTYKIISLPT